MTFQFASPWLLGLLALVFALALLLLSARSRHQFAGLRYADVRLVTRLPSRAVGGGLSRTWRSSLRPLLTILRLSAIALVVVALARPQIVQGKEIVNGEGLDIVLALDISGSMASLDFEPQNRLQAAKAVIGDFVGKRPYDRIWLVVFASEAFNQVPLTTDRNVLDRLLDQVQLATNLNIEDGTAIGLGLANAANMVKASDVASKVVILLTDGVNNAGPIDPITAAEAASTLGIKVYTIGMGRPGPVPVPVPDLFGGTQVVYQESQIDEAALQQIAEKTGGLYFRAEDTAGLRAIYDRINELETSQIEITHYAQVVELAGWLMLPALALMVLERGLGHTIFRRIP